MFKKLLILLLMCLEMGVQGAQVLWAALDESSLINVNGSTVHFLDYRNGSGQFINAARIVAGGNPAPLWIPQSIYIPEAYWETEYPEICLRDDEGWYGMPEYSSQFDMGNNPDDNMMVIFELGYIDWDDESSPFITLATAESTYGQLNSEKHIYPAGTLNPPIEANWMPIIFYAYSPVPEPSITILALLGACAILLKRK